MKKKVTTHSILKMKRSGEKIAAITSYDYLSTKLIDETGIDLILVGDSLGMVIMGYENTIPVTMEEMIHHLKAVTRAKPSAMVAGDMPFMSYQASVEDAVRNAGRLVKEGGRRASSWRAGAGTCRWWRRSLTPRSRLSAIWGSLRSRFIRWAGIAYRDETTSPPQ